jgi:hypothetical protein
VPVGMALTSLEPRLALRKEGGHTLAGVLRLAATQMRDRSAIEERAEVARRGEVMVSFTERKLASSPWAMRRAAVSQIPLPEIEQKP